MKIFLNENVLFSGDDWIPEDPNEINSNISVLYENLNYFKFYIEAIYYTGNGIGKLIDNFSALESFTDYSLSNPIDAFRVILEKIEAINWDDIKKQKSDHLYYYLYNGGATTHYLNNNSISEAAEYKFEDAQEAIALLNLAASEFNKTDTIHVTRSNTNPPKEINLLQLTNIVSKKNTISYIIKNRQARLFNWNAKHGENGTGTISNKGEIVSPLLCSKSEAEELLPSAIGFRNTNELYAYDSVRSKFIVFKNENTMNNTYHAYHPINQNEIPKYIQEFLLADN